MRGDTILLLWDDSHLWGVMAWRAIRSFGLECRLVKSKEIAQGGILGKGALLLAPGGGARGKARSLGAAGLGKIRAWVAEGGVYFGFCGGAGLALLQERPEAGLGLCPWRREAYARRRDHFLSGHVRARMADGGSASLPVWWPGRFAPENEGDVKVLARYEAPGPDLWLGDYPLAAPQVFFSPDGTDRRDFRFPAGSPLIVSGSYGRGAFMLSYSHLETPASPQANSLLAALLRQFAGLKAARSKTPEWVINCPAANELAPDWLEAGGRQILDCLAGLLSIMNEGIKKGLFYKRKAWLWGWRRGIPGIACANLLAALSAAAQARPGGEALAYWRHSPFREDAVLFLEKAGKFFRQAGAEKYGLSEELQRERDLLFGTPLEGEGLAQKLLLSLEDFIHLAQDDK